MTDKKLKIVILTHGGCELVIGRLAALDAVELTGVFIETETAPQRSFTEKLRRSLRYDGWAATVRKFAAKLFAAGRKVASEEEIMRGSRDETVRAAEKAGVPVVFVRNYHDADAIEQIRRMNADLGVIYGTNIVKETVFAVPRLGSINLHQGLAPLYRGGPSVFWELFNDEAEVGVTVHFVAAKVDTGDVILQKTFPLRYDFCGYDLNFEDFLENYRAGLREPAAEMIAEAARLVAEGCETRSKQDLTLGKRYRLPVKKEKDEMRRRLRRRLREQEKSGECEKKEQFGEKRGARSDVRFGK